MFTGGLRSDNPLARMNSTTSNQKTQREQRRAALGVREADIEEVFVRSSGPGGQSVNKTSTAVVLVHRPTGLRVRCETERSQARNRARARQLLLTKIEQRQQALRQAARDARERERRRKRKRPRGVQERILQSKARQSHKKMLRRKVVIE